MEMKEWSGCVCMRALWESGCNYSSTRSQRLRVQRMLHKSIAKARGNKVQNIRLITIIIYNVPGTYPAGALPKSVRGMNAFPLCIADLCCKAEVAKCSFWGNLARSCFL